MPDEMTKEEIVVVLEDLTEEGFLTRAGDGNYNLNTRLMVKLREKILGKAPFNRRKELVEFVAQAVGDILKTSTFFDGATDNQKKELCEMIAFVALKKTHDAGEIGMYY